MTGFKGVRNTNGRPKGAVNKTTTEMKVLLQKIVSNELENIANVLEQLSEKERIDAVIRLLPYILPKQSEISIEAENRLNKFEPLTIHLIK